MSEDKLVEIIERLARVEVKIDSLSESVKKMNSKCEEAQEELDCKISSLEKRVEGAEAAKWAFRTKMAIFICSFLGGLISSIVLRLIG